MRRGFTLVEALVSLAMIGVVIATVYPTIAWLSTRTKRLQFEGQGALVLQEGMEAAYSVFLWNFDRARVNYPEGTYILAQVPTYTPARWELVPAAAQVVDGRFTRTITLANVTRDPLSGVAGPGSNDFGSRKVTTTVKWMEQSAEKQIKAELLLVELP